MLDQEDDPELDDEWLTANDQLTHFSKSMEQIVGRIKGTELPSVQGPQSSDEELVVRERVPSRTEIPSVREPGTNGNHAPIGQHRTAVLVLIAKKSRSQWTMRVQTGMKTNMLHLQLEKL